MKDKIREFLAEENKNIFLNKTGLEEINGIYQGVFEFLEESMTKSINSLCNNNIIDSANAQNRKEKIREEIRELKNLCLETAKTSYLLWNQGKQIEAQGKQIEEINKENQDLNKKIIIAQEEILIYKENAEKSVINTLKDLEKGLDNTRKDLVSIGKSAENFNNLKEDNIDLSKIGNIQNNIIGNLEGIIKNLENLGLWPEYEETPTFVKSDKVKAKSLKTGLKRAKKKKNVETDKINQELDIENKDNIDSNDNEDNKEYKQESFLDNIKENKEISESNEKEETNDSATIADMEKEEE